METSNNDIFQQVEEFGYVATHNGKEVHKVLYINRELEFIVTDNSEILKLDDDFPRPRFWAHRKFAGYTDCFYFYPHKQKQKYYQWVLIDSDNEIFLTSHKAVISTIINGTEGYFTKEAPPSLNLKLQSSRWIPILETEKEF